MLTLFEDCECEAHHTPHTLGPPQSWSHTPHAHKFCIGGSGGIPYCQECITISNQRFEVLDKTGASFRTTWLCRIITRTYHPSLRTQNEDIAQPTNKIDEDTTAGTEEEHNEHQEVEGTYVMRTAQNASVMEYHSTHSIRNNMCSVSKFTREYMETKTGTV